MSSRKSSLSLVTGALLLSCGLTSCSRSAKPSAPGTVVRLAVLPTENLTGDAAYDWLRKGMQTAIVEQLRFTEKTRASAIDTPSEAAGGAYQILHTRISKDAHGVLLEQALESGASHKFVETKLRAPFLEDTALETARQIAGDFAPKPEPLGTKSVAAFRDFVEGQYEKAATADPSFADAWMRWAAATAQSGKMPEALELIDRARKQIPADAPLARVRLQRLEGEIRQDPAMQRAAVYQLAAAMSGDLETQAAAGQAAVSGREYPKAIAFYQKALTIDSTNQGIWNSLAYAQAYQGDYAGAGKSLDEYIKISNGTPNAFDSKGEIEFMAARFAEAEKSFLAAHKKEPGFLNGMELRKAAEARLHTGDSTGAMELARQYLTSRKEAGDVLAEFHGGEWLFRIGKRNEAFAALEAIVKAGQRPAAAVAAVQLSAWYLEAGNFDRAKEMALQSQRLGAPGGVLALAVVCFQASLPVASDAEMQLQARSAFQAPALNALRNQTVAMRLTYHGKFAESVPFWRAALDASPAEGDFIAREMLAWALVMSGDMAAAGSILKSWPPPVSDEISVFDAQLRVSGPYLRARVAEHAGKADDARRFDGLFLKSAPSEPDRFGMASRARKSATL